MSSYYPASSADSPEILHELIFPSGKEAGGIAEAEGHDYLRENTCNGYGGFMSEKKYIGICGSLRRASRNMGLLRCAAESMPSGATLEIADITEFPFYSEDTPKPACVQKLIDSVKEADGLVLAVPEYNYSVAPALKNALDWLSREPGFIMAGKPAAIMGAGGGMGTARAQYHLRQTAVYLDLRVLNKPEVFANAFTPAFSEDGSVADSPEGQKLRGSVQKLMEALCASRG